MEIKERIASQAGELFIQHGAKNVSMDEIASKLGMSKRTVYQHFTDKEELLIYFIELFARHNDRYFLEMTEKSPSMIHVFLQLIDLHRNIIESSSAKFDDDIRKYFPKAQKVIEAHRTEGAEKIKKFLKAGIRQGVVRSDLNVDVTAFLLQDVNNTFINAKRTGTLPFSIWELFHTMMINFIRGISSEKGIRIVDEYLKKEGRGEEIRS
ncbi:MAG: TetR/AcrR family transcriptional regulator [Bacteroidia bacterium]|nr:TetR/AcrR family transcriptional regulator [Bacteroidia bacterium]